MPAKNNDMKNNKQMHRGGAVFTNNLAQSPERINLKIHVLFQQKAMMHCRMRSNITASFPGSISTGYEINR